MSNFIRMNTEEGVDIGLTVYDTYMRVSIVEKGFGFYLNEDETKALICHLQACIVRMEGEG